MVNPPLLFVSALFFLAISAVLYSGAWLLIEILLRKMPHLSPHRAKLLLSAALVLPPLIACIFTVGGAFLRHSHNAGASHHSDYCGEIAQFLAIPEGKLPVLLGVAVQIAAWVLLLYGAVTVTRLIHATIALERGLSPYLHLPSEKLATTVVKISHETDCAGLQFYEADVPMAFSCLIGIRSIRCVLSRELVSSSTREELEAIVLHEANHFRSGDVWRTLCVGMLNCLFYCIRPVTLLSRRWREATELACDAATTRTTGNPLALASAILRTQGVPVPGLRLPGTTLGFAEQTACSPEKRIERLLAYAQGSTSAARPKQMSVWQWATTAVLAVVGLFVLLSPGALCLAHCALEAVSRGLH